MEPKLGTIEKDNFPLNKIYRLSVNGPALPTCKQLRFALKFTAR